MTCGLPYICISIDIYKEKERKKERQKERRGGWKRGRVCVWGRDGVGVCVWKKERICERRTECKREKEKDSQKERERVREWER